MRLVISVIAAKMISDSECWIGRSYFAADAFAELVTGLPDDAGCGPMNP